MTGGLPGIFGFPDMLFNQILQQQNGPAAATEEYTEEIVDK